MVLVFAALILAMFADTVSAYAQDNRPQRNVERQDRGFERDGERSFKERGFRQGQSGNQSQGRPFGQKRIQDSVGGQRQGQSGRGFGKGQQGFDREKIKQELMALPPEERQQRMEQLRQQHKGKIKERRQQLESKWQDSTPEQKQKFCQKVQQKCTSGGKKFACRLAQEKCGG